MELVPAKDYRIMSYMNALSDLCNNTGPIAEFTKNFPELNEGNFDRVFEAALSTPDYTRLAMQTTAIFMTMKSENVDKKLMTQLTNNIFTHINEKSEEEQKEILLVVADETACVLNNLPNRRMGPHCLDIFDQLNEFKALANLAVKINETNKLDAINLKTVKKNPLFG